MHQQSIKNGQSHIQIPGRIWSEASQQTNLRARAGRSIDLPKSATRLKYTDKASPYVLKCTKEACSVLGVSLFTSTSSIFWNERAFTRQQFNESAMCRAEYLRSSQVLGKLDKTKKKNFYEITSLIYYKPSSAIHTIVTMQFICCMVDEVDKNDFWG